MLTLSKYSQIIPSTFNKFKSIKHFFLQGPDPATLSAITWHRKNGSGHFYN